jgi:molybdopterin/thiamine biosynthesis adenylyltransferase
VMDWMREAPEPLSRAQLSLETVEGSTFLQTFRWNEQAKRWTIKFRVLLPELDSDSSLKNSDWYLAVDESYPLGRIDIYPAKENGITDTHPHQRYNHEGDSSLPWRAGNICANTQAKIIGRHGYDVEPYTTEDRLLWHCQRAIEWIRCASKGELVLPGEPFELPHIPPFGESSKKILLSEGALDASPWSNTQASSGRARCFNLRTNEKMWFLELLMGPKSEALVQVSWGQHVNRLRGKTWDGVWLRLPDMPAVKPYRFPETWGELKQALSDHGVSLRETLSSTTEHLRDREVHFLLVGFPIPAVFKSPSAIMHWIAIALPVLSRDREYPKYGSFRANAKGYIENDMRTRFRSDNRLVYMPTENWHPDQIQNRGRFQEGLRTSRVAVIGCGALGAPIAELLVRGGVHHMTLFDGERIEIGNLTRHTLTLSDIANGKSAQLAQRLNSLNPHAEVAYVHVKIAFEEEDISNQLMEHDLIVDCTGNDELLHALSAISFPNSVHFFSLSIGFRAKRMFFFHTKDVSFPVDNYLAEMCAWIEAEQNEFKGETFPREGIGCYHPVFPARCDDMWLWGSIAVKAISRVIDDSKPVKPMLYVYEQNREEDGSVSIRRAIEVPAYE